MSDESANRKRIAGELKSYIDDQFARGKSRVFLSTMGSELRDAKENIEKQFGMRFSEFIAQELDFPIGKTGEHMNVLFLVPEGQSPDALEDEQEVPRFIRSFWTAFARPLSDGESRYINLRTLRFGETAESVRSGSDKVIEIESEFIAAEEKSRDVLDMAGRIDGWLSKHELEKERFIFRPKKSLQSGKSVLVQMIDLLSESQMKRVSLPLDVIKTLS